LTKSASTPCRASEYSSWLGRTQLATRESGARGHNPLSHPIFGSGLWVFETIRPQISCLHARAGLPFAVSPVAVQWPRRPCVYTGEGCCKWILSPLNGTRHITRPTISRVRGHKTSAVVSAGARCCLCSVACCCSSATVLQHSGYCDHCLTCGDNCPPPTPTPPPTTLPSHHHCRCPLVLT
jgi:hypothetical protein